MRRAPPCIWLVALALVLSGCAAHRPDLAPSPEAALEASPVRTEVPPVGPPPELRVPAQRHFWLSNGLAVRLVEYRRLPIVALELVLGAGASRDPESQPGLAAFTAAMVTEGTKRRTATQISDDLGFIGAHLAATASFDAATVAGAALSRHLDPLLEILGDVVANPTFPEADFTRVRDERLVFLVQQRDTPSALASKTFAGLFWTGHPYGHWPMGTETSLRAMRREDLARYHAQTWRPANAELVVVGDVGEAELRAALERTLGAWPAGERPPPVAAPLPAHPQRAVLLEKAGAPQAFVLLGMPGLARSSPDFHAAEVTFQILGGGAASRLFRSLREEHGYTYGVYARSEARQLGGTAIIAGSIRSDVTGAAVKAILEEIRSLRETPVGDAELADAKGSLILSLPAEFSTAAGIAARLAEEVIHGLPDDTWDRYAEEIEKVTAADVQRVAGKVLDSSQLTTVMVGEAGQVRPQLSGLALGRVEVRAASGGDR